ncbi:laforin-like [Branchiostoma floridae]|uniref:Laforin-like n=1 Tax=Branchiostoma floridae TaxID=7739 RepID=A0A9J7N7H5_BRAFL|nr:laforin-like [Branchiostoma floridae]
MVKVRFGLVTYVDEDVTVSVVGSVKELGQWNLAKAVPLHPAVPPETTEEASFWVGDVELYKGIEPAIFQYKFVRRSTTGGGEGGDAWEWEGSGPAHNRWWIPEEEEKNMVGNGVYLTPVAAWKEPDGDPHTLEHTASFYYTICDSRTMHYSEVVENLWVGSCPRIPAHITHGMKTALGVTAVINLQREEDVCADSAGCCPGVPSTDVPDSLSQLYKDHGISYVWIPANDWDPRSKVGVLPAAVYKLWELLKTGHHVYVYCNAGIIRSVLIVCGYLYYVLGWPYRVMEYHVCSQRPVAYVDQDIILRAEKEFQDKFGSDVLAERCTESPRSYQPQPPPKIPAIQAPQTEQNVEVGQVVNDEDPSEDKKVEVGQVVEGEDSSEDHFVAKTKIVLRRTVDFPSEEEKDVELE